MISEKMIVSISQQIKKEYESAYLYLEIGEFFGSRGLKGFRNWYFIQAREEEDHAMIFYDYLSSNNAKVQFYSIEPEDSKFSDLITPIKQGVNHEKFITSSINKIYELAEHENDYRTKQFLNWFIEEQMEEESSAQELLDKMEMFGETSSGLYQLDKEFAEREYVKSPKVKI